MKKLLVNKIITALERKVCALDNAVKVCIEEVVRNSTFDEDTASEISEISFFNDFDSGVIGEIILDVIAFTPETKTAPKFEITKENHKIVERAICAAKTHTELENIRKQIHSLLHEPQKLNLIPTEIIGKMKSLRDSLESAPSVNEMIEL